MLASIAARLAPRGNGVHDTWRESILLVEDEPAVRQLFSVALRRGGYIVHEACHGQDALKIFDQHGEGIDLLLTDVRMPFMSGDDLARQLRLRRHDLKVLCISGYAGGIELGWSQDFLAKPFSRDELFAKVREILER